MNFKLAVCKMIFEQLNDNISMTFDLQLVAFFSKSSEGASDKKSLPRNTLYDLNQ